MDDLIKFWTTYGLQIIESAGILIGGLIGIIAMIKFKGGKDIDEDGKADVNPKFNNYFIIHNGEVIYLKDMKFFKEKDK